MPDQPSRLFPHKDWQHFQLWERINALFSSLPNYFETELIVRGINVTEIFSLGSALTSVVDVQVVAILNKLRPVWDPDNKYADYAFIRQSQTFPDVLLRNQRDSQDILFGIELKSWYLLSKEGEPSFRYQVTSEACTVPDLLVVIPWLLSDVISGTPKLMMPYKELARYASEYRNYYWWKSRIERNEVPDIRKPPVENRHPYPNSKQESSDEAEGDKGGNFGRIARSGILDEYITSLKEQDYLGIKIRHWITFFKAISENRTDVEIDRKLQSLKTLVHTELPQTKESQKTFLELLERVERLWRTIH